MTRKNRKRNEFSPEKPKVSVDMLEEARQALMQGQRIEMSFNVLIDSLFEEQIRCKMGSALDYLEDWCRKDPKTFEVRFCNIHNFINIKIQEQRRKAARDKKYEKVDYLQL